MSNKKETIKQIIDLLSSLIEEDTDQDKVVKNQPKPKTKNIRSKKTKAKGANVNKFESMSIRDMHKEDVAVDKILNSRPPCPRTRQYSTIDVCCRSCGKKEKVNPVLVAEASRYKCNTCSMSGG